MVRRELKKPAVIAAGVLFLIFVVFLGTFAGNSAFALLLCLHGTGFVWFLEPCFADRSLAWRVMVSLAILVLLTGFIYTPARNLVERHLVAPVRAGERVVIVKHVRNPAALRQGDIIAYRVSGSSGSGVYVREGFGLGPVLALGGDKVEFLGEQYSVNGVRRPLLPNMPANGSLVVPEKHWFVWPEVAKQGYGHYGGTLDGVLLRMAVIPEEQIIGKAFKRWFLRRQVL